MAYLVIQKRFRFIFLIVFWLRSSLFSELLFCHLPVLVIFEKDSVSFVKIHHNFYKKSAKKPEEEEDVQSKIIHLIQEGEELIKQEDYAGAEKRFIDSFRPPRSSSREVAGT